MKNIAICYSQHAIKVSDSYCSGPSNHAQISAQSPPSSIQTAVTSIYSVKLSSGKQFLIRISWCSPLNHAFSITISDYPHSNAKLSRNFNILRRQRGSENLVSGGLTADVLWDLRSARYESGREPVAGFYVAVLVNSELCVVVGDMERELMEVNKCVCDLKVAEFSLISRGERFCGGGVYRARSKFSETGRCHDILIRFSGEEGMGRKRSLLGVYVDKKSVMEVKRLQWNFRGNESIFVDGLLVDLMWDVHDWLFSPSSASPCAVFMFRTRTSGLRLHNTSLCFLDQQPLLNTASPNFSFLIFASINPD